MCPCEEEYYKKVEAADGEMTMVISDKLGAPTRAVVVHLQAMGAYSDT